MTTRKWTDFGVLRRGQLRWLVPAAIALAQVLWLSLPAATQSEDDDQQSTQSFPKDDSRYARPAESGERGRSRVHPKVFLADTVVSNTNPNLTNTDTFNDGELSIAINPNNHDEIAITSFGGSWSATSPNAPVWHSLDGGVTWTKQFSLPRPPGVPSSGCPCDQTIDYGRNNLLSSTFLTVPTNVYSGTTSNPTIPGAFNWFVSGGVTRRTNQVATNNADQPWLLVNRDPNNPDQDNVYVAYDDFSGAPNMRVAAA